MSTPVIRPAPLSATAIAQAVFAIEAGLDLDDSTWVQHDVHWWPLYRLEIYRLLFTSQSGANSGAGGRGLLDRLRKQLGPALRLQPSAAGLAPLGALWLVSDGLSWSSLGEREVERFCTPLQQWSADLGVPSTLIDRASTALRAGQPAAHWWAPTLQRQKMAAAVASRLRPSRQHAELVRRVGLAAARTGVALSALSPKKFDTLARAVLMMAEPLHRLMLAEQVRAVFLVSFYDVTGYAFTLAAARAGVRCVDLQHGVTGPHHLAYTPWPRLRQFPPGWRLLPSHFWSWSVADAQLINDWGRHCQPARHAVCGGHPFLEAWTSGLMQLPDEMQTRLQRLLVAAQGRQRVLVTLQPGLTHAEALAPLLQAWKLQPEVSWWLRLHPMALAEGPAIAALAQAHGARNFDIESATALPLPVLLAHAHVHSTHSSSTVIEAQTVGLSSVIWSSYGAELAQEQLAAGDATLALDGPSLVQALLLAPRPRHWQVTEAPADPTAQGRKTAQGDNRQGQGQGQGPRALRHLLEMHP